jgi:hypothetical protein
VVQRDLAARPNPGCVGAQLPTTAPAASLPSPGDRAASGAADAADGLAAAMIRKLPSGKFRLYSRKVNPRTLRRRNLGTFDTLDEAKQHEREIQIFNRDHAPR